MNRVDQMADIQQQALDVYGRERIPNTGGLETVLASCVRLRALMDAEVRHVTLLSTRLVETLADVFVECVCALVEIDHGEGHTTTFDEIVVYVREDVFAPKNAEYGDSFADYGAAGVVIRLLDNARRLEHGSPARPNIVNMSNYAIMALMLLSDVVGDLCTPG